MDDANRDEVGQHDQETQLETQSIFHKGSRQEGHEFGARETRRRCALRDTGAGMERKPTQNILTLADRLISMQERHVEGAGHICAWICPTFLLAGDVSPLTTLAVQVEVRPRGFVSHRAKGRRTPEMGKEA